MINRREVTKLLSLMHLIRSVEERIATEYRNQEMRCPTHLSIGQEAIAAGVCFHLMRRDIVFSNHRSHAHYLAKGGSLPAMIAEIYGKTTGCSRGYGGSQHLIDLSVNFWGSAPIVASTIPVAVGAALSVAMKKERRIVVSFFGEAAVEEGVFWESANFAVLKKLPILFVCENNLYSTNTPIRERQPNRPIYSIVQALGVGSFQEDGNDALKVHSVAGAAIAAIRKRIGPQFIEFLTYRTREHCGPNEDPSGFRPESEISYWRRRDPIERLERFMKAKRFLGDSEVAAMKARITRSIDWAFQFALKSPYPRETLTENILYAP